MIQGIRSNFKVSTGSFSGVSGSRFRRFTTTASLVKLPKDTTYITSASGTKKSIRGYATDTKKSVDDAIVLSAGIQKKISKLDQDLKSGSIMSSINVALSRRDGGFEPLEVQLNENLEKRLQEQLAALKNQRTDPLGTFHLDEGSGPSTQAKSKALPKGELEAVKVSVTTTEDLETMQALANKEKLDRLDLSWDIFVAESNRHSGGPPPYYAPPDKIVVRYDNFPHDSVSQNQFKSPKVYVNRDGGLVPPGKRLDAFRHVLGRFPAKADSAFTSVVDTANLSKPVKALLLGWGKNVITVNSNKTFEMLTVADVQREIRRSADTESLQVAKNRDGSKWNWKKDEMFKDPEMADITKKKMIEHGIDPHKVEYSDSERARIYNAALDELLVVGSTSPGSATVGPANEL